MIATCQSCGSHERLAPHQIAGRTGLVRCRTCRGLLVAEALCFETRKWWVVIGTTMCGPYTARELKVLVEHGDVHGGSWLWTHDMASWERVHLSERLAFAAAWIRELHSPLPVVEGRPLALEPEGALPIGARFPALSEVGLHAAVGLATLVALGGGFFAGGVVLG